MNEFLFRLPARQLPIAPLLVELRKCIGICASERGISLMELIDTLLQLCGKNTMRTCELHMQFRTSIITHALVLRCWLTLELKQVSVISRTEVNVYGRSRDIFDYFWPSRDGSKTLKIDSLFANTGNVASWLQTLTNEPKTVMVMMGHNDVCGGLQDKVQTSCSSTDLNPADYCRTSVGSSSLIPHPFSLLPPYLSFILGLADFSVFFCLYCQALLRGSYVLVWIS